ncbi:MAG: tetratricopeptide repeat protein [Phycisphaerales bacterium]
MSHPRSAPGAAEHDGSDGQRRLGGYELVERIAEGGAAIVWRGRQVHPVRRDVALKILRHPPGTPADLRRFDLEVRALSSLQHPHIGSLFDIGVTDSGRPYLVMPLVKGMRLDDPRIRRQLDFRDRVLVMRQVADAVHHAHVRGVVHRDLSPGNVLVDPRPGDPHATVIDFGISRILDDLDEAGAARTRPGVLLGTPRYLSPEQAAGGAAASDARADIHAIGVLAYELLTDVHPFAAADDDASADGLEAMRYRIIDEHPARPSGAAIREHGSFAATAARSLRAELDWLLLECLRKDPADRPSSARFVAEEFSRFLAGEPLRTEPPTRSSRLAVRWRRHRGAVLAAAAIGGALIVGLVGTSYGLVEARKAIARVEASRAALVEAEAAAVARADEADRIARFQERLLGEVAPVEVAAMLRRGMQDAIGQPLDPKTEGNNAVSRRIAEADLTGVASRVMERAVLVEAVDRARTEFADVPLVQARVLEGIGTAYQSMGLSEPTIEIFEDVATLRRSAGGPPDGVRSAEAGLAAAFDHLGRHAEAGELYERIVAGHLADHGPDARQTLAARHNLAVHFLRRGDRDRALPEIRSAALGRAATIGDDAPETVDSRLVLASALAQLGASQPEAKVLYDDILATQRRTLAPDDPRLLRTLSVTASFALEHGDPKVALARATEAWEGRRTIFGADHPATVVAAGNRGLALWKLKRLDEAQVVLEEVLRVRSALHGAGHRDVLRSRHNLALVLGDLGDHAGALAEHRAILAILDRRGERQLRLGLTQLNAIGVLLRRQGLAAEAVPVLEEVVGARAARFGSRHRSTQIARSNLIQALDEAGRLGEAITIQEAFNAVVTENRGPEDAVTLNSRMRRGTLLVRNGQANAGLAELRAVHERFCAVDGQASIGAVTSAVALAAGLGETGAIEAALTVVDDAIDACPAPADPAFPPRLGSAYQRLVDEQRRLTILRDAR